MKQDSRLMSLMNQLVKDLKHDADIDDMVRDTRTVKASDSGTIVVPCIAASRVESDVTTTLQALKLSKYFVLMGDGVLQYVQVVHQGKVNLSFPLRGDKVSMLTHIYPHKPWRNIEVTICKITRLTAHFVWPDV